MTLGWFICLPLVIVVQLLRGLRPSARYYLSPERDVVLAVVATRAGWLIEDHFSARPGHGLGRRLRARLLPDLTASADTDGVPIVANAATTALAARYCAELPGLVDVGRAFPRGRRLCRWPKGSGMMDDTDQEAR